MNVNIRWSDDVFHLVVIRAKTHVPFPKGLYQNANTRTQRQDTKN